MSLNKHVKIDILLTVITSGALAICTFFLSSSYGTFTPIFKFLFSTIAAALPPLSLYFRHKGSAESSKKLSIELNSIRELLVASTQTKEVEKKQELLEKAESKYQALAKEFNEKFDRELESHKINVSQRRLGKLDVQDKLQKIFNSTSSIAENLAASFSTETTFKFRVTPKPFDILSLKNPSLPTKVLAVEFKNMKFEISFQKIGGEKRFMTFIVFENTPEDFTVVIHLDLQDDQFEISGSDIPSPIGEIIKRYKLKHLEMHPLNKIDTALEDLLGANFKYLALCNHN